MNPEISPRIVVEGDVVKLVFQEEIRCLGVTDYGEMSSDMHPHPIHLIEVKIFVPQEIDEIGISLAGETS